MESPEHRAAVALRPRELVQLWGLGPKGHGTGGEYGESGHSPQDDGRPGEHLVRAQWQP